MAEAVAPPTAAAAAAGRPPRWRRKSMGTRWGPARRRGWPGLRPTTFPTSSPRQIRTTTAARRATDAMGGAAPADAVRTGDRPIRGRPSGRTPFGLLVAGLVLVLLAIALAVWFVLRNNESTPSPSSTTVSTTAPPAPPASEAPPPPASEAPPPPAGGATARHADDHAANRRPSRRRRRRHRLRRARRRRRLRRHRRPRRRPGVSRRRRRRRRGSSRRCRTRPSRVCRSFRAPIQPRAALGSRS